MSVKIKICGVTNPQDAVAIEKYGADFIGLIFEPASPRCVSIKEGAAVAQSLSGNAKTVGVFVNQSVDFILRAVKECGLFAVQLHGGQNEDFAAKLKATGCEIWKVAWLENADNLQAAAAFACDRVLVDSRSKSAVGGTGIAADKNFAKALAAQRSMILAGGISPDNVCESIAYVNPWAVDANSKVEISPRKKDLIKVKNLIEKIKNSK